MQTLKMIMLLGTIATLIGCQYTAATRVGKDMVVVTKNTAGVANKAFVCKITKGGLRNCMANESP